MTKDYRLRELKVEVNRGCPLHCLHCSSNGEPRAPECLDSQKVSELIIEFAYLGGEKLCISGGEPLCHEGLPTIIHACRDSNLQTVIYTTGIASNGSLPKAISDSTVDLLAESGSKVIFSLHGACAEIHDRLTCVEGSFDTTMVAIEKVLKNGLEVEIHVVPMAINFHELSSVSKLLNSFHIQRVSWLRFVPQGRGLLNQNILQLSKEQLGRLAEKKVQLQRIYPSVKIRTGAPFNILCPQVPTPCDAGLSVLTICPDGSIAPCDAFKRFRLPDEFGNILHHSLVDVWYKSSFLNAIRNLREPRRNSLCDSCSLFSKCNSGCLAQKCVAAGKITNGRDPECPLNGVEIGDGEVKAVAVR